MRCPRSARTHAESRRPREVIQRRFAASRSSLFPGSSPARREPASAGPKPLLRSRVHAGGPRPTAEKINMIGTTTAVYDSGPTRCADAPQLDLSPASHRQSARGAAAVASTRNGIAVTPGIQFREEAFGPTRSTSATASSPAASSTCLRLSSRPPALAMARPFATTGVDIDGDGLATNDRLRGVDRSASRALRNPSTRDATAWRGPEPAGAGRQR